MTSWLRHADVIVASGAVNWLNLILKLMIAIIVKTMLYLAITGSKTRNILRRCKGHEFEKIRSKVNVAKGWKWTFLKVAGQTKVNRSYKSRRSWVKLDGHFSQSERSYTIVTQNLNQNLPNSIWIIKLPFEPSTYIFWNHPVSSL